MKRLTNEIRLWLAEWLLGRAMLIAPYDTRDGRAILVLGYQYFSTRGPWPGDTP